jgi:hypothetical protein
MCSDAVRRASPMEDELNSLRAKLASLVGVPLDDLEIVRVLGEAIKGGGGVSIELDEATRYRVIRRDGKLQLYKEGSRRPSTLPPRR